MRILFILFLLVATNASALNVTLTKQDEIWTVYNSTYIEGVGADPQGVYVTIGANTLFPLKSGSCRVTTLNHTLDDFEVKARVTCEGRDFALSFTRYGNAINPADLPEGSQVTVSMFDDRSSDTPASRGSSVPAKKAPPSYPNHYRGRQDPSHEH